MIDEKNNQKYFVRSKRRKEIFLNATNVANGRKDNPKYKLGAKCSKHVYITHQCRIRK
jgi:hypothetical protein